MDVILSGIIKAFKLIFSFDNEIYEIVFLSLYVSFVALIIAFIIGLPLGVLIGKSNRRISIFFEKIIYTLMGLPPVLCGLFVYLILMRRGPLGHLQLNYTVRAMIIAQSLLIIPIVTGIIVRAIKTNYSKISKLAKTLGANKFETFKLVVYELRYQIQMALVSGYSRGISEVGAVMIVGGNIKGKTRVMTTFISELKSMGEFEKAVAVGIILLIISFLINTLMNHFTKKDTK